MLSDQPPPQKTFYNAIPISTNHRFNGILMRQSFPPPNSPGASSKRASIESKRAIQMPASDRLTTIADLSPIRSPSQSGDYCSSVDNTLDEFLSGGPQTPRPLVRLAAPSSLEELTTCITPQATNPVQFGFKQRLQSDTPLTPDVLLGVVVNASRTPKSAKKPSQLAASPNKNAVKNATKAVPKRKKKKKHIRVVARMPPKNAEKKVVSGQTSVLSKPPTHRAQLSSNNAPSLEVDKENNDPQKMQHNLRVPTRLSQRKVDLDTSTSGQNSSTDYSARPSIKDLKDIRVNLSAHIGSPDQKVLSSEQKSMQSRLRTPTHQTPGSSSQSNNNNNNTATTSTLGEHPKTPIHQSVPSTETNNPASGDNNNISGSCKLRNQSMRSIKVIQVRPFCVLMNRSVDRGPIVLVWIEGGRFVLFESVDLKGLVACGLGVRQWSLFRRNVVGNFTLLNYFPSVCRALLEQVCMNI